MDHQSAELINLLFQKLQAIFPAFRLAWPSQIDYERAKREWMKAFIDAGLSDYSLIRVGIKRFRLLDKPFVPSPGQFIKMCFPTPEDLGCPSHTNAFKEALKNSSPYQLDKKFSHSVVEHAWLETGSINFTRLKEHEIRRLFYYNYDMALKQLIHGEPFRAITKGIGEDNKSKSTKEVALSHLERMKEILK